MTTRTKPTKEQLHQIASQHLSWEALCLLDSLGFRGNRIPFNRSIGILFDFGKGRRRSFNHPLGMHDLVIHTRVIADFLRCPSNCGNSYHEDDIEAGDYIGNWKGVDVLGKDRDSFNKSLAHLSRTRLTRNVMKASERRDIAKKTLGELRKFVSQVPEEYEEWFSDLKKMLNEDIYIR